MVSSVLTGTAPRFVRSSSAAASGVAASHNYDTQTRGVLVVNLGVEHSFFNSFH